VFTHEQFVMYNDSHMRALSSRQPMLSRAMYVVS
jgi:hypothetical protein